MNNTGTSTQAAPHGPSDLPVRLDGGTFTLLRGVSEPTATVDMFAATQLDTLQERYSNDMSQELDTLTHLETALRLAIDNAEFLVYYQPKASCRTGSITGFEALLRWNHPLLGVIPPAEFIPTLERTGLIQVVGAWVLRTACAQLAEWLKAGYTNLHMAINLSLQQLAAPDFPEQVQGLLKELGIPPGRIELEITESMLMGNVVRSEESLRALKAIGIQLSIDDFGTGYSSLSYLKRLPIDTIKVDRSFVKDITTDPNDASITRAIVSMAHSLRLKVVAEGVETEAQIAKLVAETCETIQGYFISKPIPADAATDFLASGWLIPSHLLGRPAKERTLLIVDDEDSILLALRRLLRREGYRILSGKSGAEGLDILAKNDVDVVMSDQRMPEMTGEEFLRRTKDLYPHTVRMVLSGFADMASITNAINQGSIYKFMSKPWDEKTLKDGILEAFQRKEKNDARQQRAQEIVAANDLLLQDNQSLAQTLGEQSHANHMSRTALLIAQETMDKLPIPVLCIDPNGLLVSRNEAFFERSISIASCRAQLAQFPPAQRENVFQFYCQDADQKKWRAMCRHLYKGQEHRGTILAFVAASTDGNT